MDKIVIFSVSILIVSVAAPSPPSKQYRTDYEYNRNTDAFYKLHIESLSYRLIKEKCTIEGAKLMVPTSQQDIMQLHSMFKKFPDLGRFVWVGDDGQHHDSDEDEQPIIDLDPPSSETESYDGQCDVVTRDGEIEVMSCYYRLPFICKVEAKDAPYDPHCNVYASGYTHIVNNTSVGSCYKISRAAFTWSEAYAECEAEGAHLVVLNSEAEHNAVWEFMKITPAVEASRVSWFFFAGIRAEKESQNTTRVFKTIFNQTLEEAGYNQWSENEPNNYMNSEYCGSIFKNDGKYNDLDCSHEYGFICEKELHVY